MKKVTKMSILQHITKREQWEKAMAEGEYRGDTLDSQGFIHCSTPQQTVKVAKLCFSHKKDLVLLYIAANKVQSAIRYEGTGSEELYPHIYGPLNVDAVIKVADFKPTETGEFVLPKKIADAKLPLNEM